MAHKHSVYDTDNHFMIDGVTRAVKNVSETKTMLVQHDHNSERFTFEITQRYIDGHDMLTCNVVQVHYINIDSSDKTKQCSGVYEVDDLRISPDSDDVVICSWLISGKATQYVGNLSFIVRFACTTNGAVDYAWNTAVHSNVFVSKGIFNGDVVAEEYADILEQWRQELIDSGGVTDDRIEAAVANYLRENPVVGGLSTAEKNLILTLFRNAAYTSANMGNTLAQLEALWNGSGEVEPDVPDTPDVPGHTHSYTSSVTGIPLCDSPGVRVYTCSCGHSYTEVIPPTGEHNYVNGVCTECGAADPNYDAGGDEPETTEPVYTLAEATTFNADNVIDTGYKLLDVEKSWSVCVDCTDTSRGGFVWDASPNASQGMALSNRGGYYRTLYVAGSLYRDIGTDTGNYKIVISHEKNTDVVNYHYVLPGTTNLVSCEITYTKYLTDKNVVGDAPLTVKIGGNYSSAASYKGTINRFEIYERVLSENEIYAFTGAELPEGVTSYATIPCTLPTENIITGYINDAGAVAELANTYTAGTYIKVTAGNSYAINAEELYAVQSYNTMMKISWFDSNGLIISREDKGTSTNVKSVTITAPNNAEYLKVGITCSTATEENISTYFDSISISEVA